MKNSLLVIYLFTSLLVKSEEDWKLAPGPKSRINTATDVIAIEYEKKDVISISEVLLIAGAVLVGGYFIIWVFKKD